MHNDKPAPDGFMGYGVAAVLVCWGAEVLKLRSYSLWRRSIKARILPARPRRDIISPMWKICGS